MRTSAFKPISTLSLALMPFLSGAQVIYTGLPWLRYTPEARAGGMAGIGLATSPDPASAFWNMGKPIMNNNSAGAIISFVPKFNELLSDSAYMGSLAGYYKIGDNQAITASMRYFSLSNIQFTDTSSTRIFEGRPREFGIDVGYSRRLSGKIGLGAALRYIHSNLSGGVASSYAGGSTGSTIAADLGLFYDGKNTSGNGFTFGAALTNLGSKIAYSDNRAIKEFIPADLGLGSVFTNNFGSRHRISLGIDLHKLLVPTPPSNATPQEWEVYQNKSAAAGWIASLGDAPGGVGEEWKEFQFSAGSEYWYNNQFAFRTGYFFEDKNRGNRKYFSVGTGVRYHVLGFDCSYLVPVAGGSTPNPLSKTMRFSLLFDLGTNAGKN